MIGLEKSFRLIYSNTHLRTHETLPLEWKKYFQKYVPVGTYVGLSRMWPDHFSPLPKESYDLLMVGLHAGHHWYI